MDLKIFTSKYLCSCSVGFEQSTVRVVWRTTNGTLGHGGVGDLEEPATVKVLPETVDGGLELLGAVELLRELGAGQEPQVLVHLADLKLETGGTIRSGRQQ